MLTIPELSGEKSRQRECILAVLTRLRKFSSHLLAAQDIVQRILHQRDILNKQDMAPNRDTSNCASTDISHFLQFVKNRSSTTMADGQPTDYDTKKRQLTGNRIDMKKRLSQLLTSLHEDQCFLDYDERLPGTCARCGEQLSGKIIISACLHLFCWDCFWALPDQNGNNGSQNGICSKCHTPITEAADFGTFNEFFSEGVSCSTSQSARKKRKRRSGAQGRIRRRNRGAEQHTMFPLPSRDSDDDVSGESTGQGNVHYEDWIPTLGEFQLGATFLGAKLTRARDIMKNWFQESGDNKVLVFTHFLDSVRLLEWMCQREGWNYTMVRNLLSLLLTNKDSESLQISGKMSIPARDHEIREFQENKKVKVMLSTFGVGGVGIDLTAANKCILLDLWWNLAVEEQVSVWNYGNFYQDSRLHETRPTFASFDSARTETCSVSSSLPKGHM